MKKLTLLLLTLLCTAGAWAQRYGVVDNAGWTISAPNTTRENGESNGKVGYVYAAIDNDLTSFYHSDYAHGDASAYGNHGVQAILIDMKTVVSGVAGITYMGRHDSSNGHTTKCRVYLYETLPAGLPADLATVANADKDALLTDEGILGTPVFENSADPWSYKGNSEVKTATFEKQNARYVLFCHDDLSSYFTCTEINVLKELSLTYNVRCSEGGVVYNGKTYKGGSVINAATAIEISQLSATELSGKYATVAIMDNEIIVGYSTTPFPVATTTLDRTGWTISAQNETDNEPVVGRDCNVQAVIDPTPNTRYHSDYSSSGQPGQNGPQGFLIDMHETVSGIIGVNYQGRTSVSSGSQEWNHTTKCRVYIYETLPEELPVDLSTLSVEEKNAMFDAETGILGTPVFDNNTTPWTYASNAEVKTAMFDKCNGRYVLFVSDDVYNRTGNKFFTCEEFNVLTSADQATYTVHTNLVGGGIDYYGQKCGYLSSITVDHTLTAAEVTPQAAVGGVTPVVSISGFDINVLYTYSPVTPSGDIAFKGMSSVHSTGAPTGYYTISGLTQNQGTKFILANADGTGFAASDEVVDNNGLWLISRAPSSNASRAYRYIYNVGARKYIKIPTGRNGEAIQLVDEPTIVEVEFSGSNAGMYAGIKINDNNTYRYVDVAGDGTKPVAWSDGLNGSRRLIFRIADVDTPELAALGVLQTTIAEQATLLGEGVGEKKADDIYYARLGDATAMTGSNTVAQINAARAALIQAFNNLSINMPEEGKFYQIISAYPEFANQQGGKRKAIYSNGDHLSWRNVSSMNEFAWSFTPTEGGYILASKEDPSVQVLESANARSKVINVGEEGAAYELVSLGQRQFNIRCVATGQDVHPEGHDNGAGASGNIVTWPGGVNSQSAWYIVEAPEEDIDDYFAEIIPLMEYFDEMELPIEEEGADLILAGELKYNGQWINFEQISEDLDAINELSYNSELEEIKEVRNSGSVARLVNLKGILERINMPLASAVFEIKSEWSTVILPCWGGSVGEGYDWTTMELYNCAAVEGNSLTLESAGSSFRYLTPYIMKGVVGEKYQVIGWDYSSKTEATSFTNGLLTGVVEDTEAPAGSYVLQKPAEGALGFYLVEAGREPVVPAGKAYLSLPEASSVKSFFFPGADEATAIEAITGSAENEPVYNLAGQRVSKAQKGVYIIGGKKVMY